MPKVLCTNMSCDKLVDKDRDYHGLGYGFCSKEFIEIGQDGCEVINIKRKLDLQKCKLDNCRFNKYLVCVNHHAYIEHGKCNSFSEREIDDEKL